MEECLERVARANGSFECYDSTFPIPLRHSWCDSLVAYVWFFTLLTCFPHTVFYFFKMEMNDGWHFFLYPSEFRDALGTPKPSLEEGGVPNKCTCRSFISQDFFPFSILLLFHALEFIPPFFLDRESYLVSLKPFRRKDLKYPS